MKKVALVFILTLLLLGTIACGTKSSTEEEVKDAVTTLYNYKKLRQWDNAWDMLHPDSKALFNNDEGEYAEYMEEVYTAISIKSFTITSVKIIPQWTFSSTEDKVGTDKTYNDVAEIKGTNITSTPAPAIDQEISCNIHCVQYDGAWAFFCGPSTSYSSLD